MYTRPCGNCGSNVALDRRTCDRCLAEEGNQGSGVPQFSGEARDTGESLGGLLRLYSVNGVGVRFVGWCPGGAFGLDANGGVVWVEDWGYMADLSVENGQLRFSGRLADIETGRLV
jgi:hypothetical protein